MSRPWTSRVLWDVPVSTVETRSGGQRELTLDFYAPDRDERHPQGAGQAPLVIYIHGGGWEEGSNDRPPGFRTILAHGYALAAVQYRFATQATADEMIGDLWSAIRVARKTAAEQGCDADRWYLWGISAGGHLASLLALTAKDAAERPRAVAPWCGVMNIPALERLDGVKPELHESITRVVSQLIRADEELAKRLSPITHVAADAPPHFLVHGTSDGLVPPTQSEQMHQSLTEAGAVSELMLVPDGTHAMPPGDSEELHRTLDFFRRAG